MSSMGRLKTEQQGDAVVVSVEGDIDLANAREVRAAFDSAPTADTAGMVVDLSRAGYVDSSGVAALVGAARELEVRRQRVMIVAPAGGSVRRVLDIVQIERIAPVYESLDEALAALGAA